MAFEQDRTRGGEHRLVLEDRERLVVSGVEEVERFDEESVTLRTAQGQLVVRGDGLHIEQLSLDGGELRLEGQVDSLTYEDDGPGRTGLLARLFG